jgi:outer membrane lipoprotein carrier protein
VPLLARNFSGCLLLVASSMLVSAQDASVITSNAGTTLDGFLAGLETYSAAFEQQLYDETGMELEKSVGVFYMRRPGMFHWAYVEPYSQMIISDGITLWVYDEDLEQVTIRNASRNIEESPAAILGGEIRIEDHYLIIEQELADGIQWLELTPRDLESQYDSIRLGLRGNQLAKMELVDNLGQKNLITFLDTRRNASLNLELFSFTPPEGVDVIDTR